jgi:transcriptional regulator with XRE-family HTH domain
MVESFAVVKTLGQFIARRRRDLGISQKEMAALLKNRDGEPLSSSYFNYLERDRGKPPDYLLDQMAEILKVGRDVLYFWAKRVPPDLEPGENVDPGRIAEAYQAFRRTIKGAGTGHGGNSVKKK